MHYQESDPIILGSGELYIGLVADITDLESLETTEEDALTNIGAIESGASITIGSEKVEVKSTNRGLVKKITTDKNIKFSTGIMTWILENISKFLLGSTYTVDGTSGAKKLVLNLEDDSPIVYLRFVHTKKTGGTLTVNIYKAQFDGELGIEFGENPTTVNYEFVGLANANKNYIEIIETDE